jgi:uncharacterized protein
MPAIPPILKPRGGNMKRFLEVLFFVSLLSANAFARAQSATDPVSHAAKHSPRADFHQHVFSPSMADFQKITPITAGDVIKYLDDAGIKRGVLLSTAYSYGRPGREPENEYARVAAENEWVGGQAALYPRRLIAFCGFNPLKDYALDERQESSAVPP